MSGVFKKSVDIKRNIGIAAGQAERGRICASLISSIADGIAATIADNTSLIPVKGRMIQSGNSFKISVTATGEVEEGDQASNDAMIKAQTEFQQLAEMTNAKFVAFLRTNGIG